MNTFLRFDIFGDTRRTAPLSFSAGDVATASTPLSVELEAVTRRAAPLGFLVFGVTRTNAPLAFGIAGAPLHPLPLAWDIAGEPLTSQLPLAWHGREGQPMPLEGLSVDRRLLDLLPLITPLGRSQLVELLAEDPAPLDPLPE